MSEDERPLLIEHAGKEWAITYDLRAMPSYRLMVLRGRSTPHNADVLLHLLRDNMDRAMMDDGRMCPVIYDLREAGPVSFQSVRSAQGLLKEFGRYTSYTVALLNPYHTERTLLRALLSMLAQGLLRRLAIADTMDEAIRLVEQYHAKEGAGGNPAAS